MNYYQYPPLFWPRPTTWILCLTVWISVARPAIGQPIAAGPDRWLDSTTRTKVVESLSQQLKAQYVFAAVAARLEQRLQSQLAAGHYDQITSSQVFADTITRQLQRISHDKHLRLFYHNKPVQSASSDSTAGADELAARKQYGRLINFGFGKPERLAGHIGYLRIDEFMPVELASETAAAAMTYLSQTDALILDLRYNRGGEPAMVAYLASYFFGPDSVHLNDIVRRGGGAVQSFWTRRQVGGKRYAGKPLYLLTSKQTFSAGEELAYDLQSLKRAIVVGEPTAGGAHSGELVWVANHFTAFIPMEYALNPVTHTNWEGKGVKPDVAVAEAQALKRAHLVALQTLLSGRSSAFGSQKKREWTTLIKQLHQ